MYITEKVDVASNNKPEAIGVLSHFKERSDEDGSRPEGCHIQAVLKPEAFATLVGALQAGRVLDRVTARVQGLEYGWEPDGSGMVWDIAKAPKAPVVELSFGIPLTPPEPTPSSDAEDEVDETNFPASGADIRRLQEVVARKIDLLTSSMWKVAISIGTGVLVAWLLLR